jgi:hypothetical protein
MATTTKALYRGAILLGSSPVRAYVSNVAIATNLATITTNAAHGYSVGNIVTITGAHASIDGTYVIYTVPSSTTFTFVSTTATLTSAAVSPVGIAIANTGATGGGTVTNRVIQNGVATITTGASHGLAIHDMVAVNIGNTSVDTVMALVVGVPSATTFNYIVTTTTLATASVTQGAWVKIPVLYTVPSATATVVTNIVVTNLNASAITFSIALGGVSLAKDSTLAANSSAYFDLKQVLDTTKTISAAASLPLVTLHASGVEIA